MPGQVDWLAAFVETVKARTYVCRPDRDDLQPPDGEWEEIAYDAMLAVLTASRDRAIGR